MTSRFALTTVSLCLFGLTLSAVGLAQQAPPAPPVTPAASAGQAQPAPGAARGGGRGAPSPACGSATTGKNMATTSRCFELRTYTVRPDSAGNIDVLHTRFRDVTARLFVKHGMSIIGFWQPVTTPDTMVYMLAYKDNAARDAQWAAFYADPEWVEARARLSVGLSVTSVFMNAADYSPVK